MNPGTEAQISLDVLSKPSIADGGRTRAPLRRLHSVQHLTGASVRSLALALRKTIKCAASGSAGDV
jgi:hypothetical protein